MAIQAIPLGEAFEPLFAVHSENDDGRVCVVLSGELDMATVPELEREVERAERRGSKVASLDLGRLSFMDAAGLRCILSMAEKAEADGRALSVVGAGPAVRRVFELTGQDGLLGDPPVLRTVSLNGDGRG